MRGEECNELEPVVFVTLDGSPLNFVLAGFLWMNRLQTRDWPEIELPAPQIEISGGVFSQPSVDQPCSMFAPLHYEPNYAYPLLVWLHGPGDDEQQLKRIMPLISLRNYIGVSIRGTQPVGKANERKGYTWSSSLAHVSQAEDQVFAAISLAQSRFNVSSERVFLAGYDLGGTMALRIALANPHEFGGVISIGGAFPQENQPLRRLHELRRLRMLIAYARDSASFPLQQVCDTIRLLHVAKMKVDLHQYPCPQQLTTAMLENADRWIMEQVTGMPAMATA